MFILLYEKNGKMMSALSSWNPLIENLLILVSARKFWTFFFFNFGLFICCLDAVIDNWNTNSSCELFKLHRQEQYENEKISLTLSQLHPFSSKLISYGYVLHHSGFHGLRRLTSGRVSVISTIHKHSEKYQTPTVPLQCPELRHLCVYSNSQPYWVLFPMINKRQAEAQEKFVFQVLSVAQ